jgi:hypothetical protein
MKKTGMDMGENTASPQPTVGATPQITTTGSILNKPTEEDTIPRDADTMQKILESMGVKDFEPRVVEQLLELLYRM